MERVYEEYRRRLSAQKMMDYDDQVVYAVQLLKALPQLLAEYHRRFPYICVDEAQDTSKSQHELLRLLVGPSGNIFKIPVLASCAMWNPSKEISPGPD